MFEDGNARYIASNLRSRVARVLFVLDEAVSIEEIAVPGFRLHELQGGKKGTWAVNVSGNWRITFRFENGLAWDVDLADYH